MGRHRERERLDKPKWYTNPWVIGLGAGGVFLLVLVVAFFTSGGGGGTGVVLETGDAADIRNLVTSLPDLTGNPTQFKTLFAAGVAPNDKQRLRYRALLFSTVSEPVVSGDTATATVLVRDDNSPNPLGQVEWTFAKEDGKWKIKSAPLP